MAFKEFEELQSKEKQGVFDACKRLGRSRDEFKILLEEKFLLPDGSYLQRKVHTQLVRSQKEKVYQAGRHTNWNAEFEADLSAGLFD